MKLLQTKLQVKINNINYYDIHYTVIKNRDEKDVVNDKYEKNENDYFSLNDIVPNEYIGTKNDNVILK